MQKEKVAGDLKAGQKEELKALKAPLFSGSASVESLLRYMTAKLCSHQQRVRAHYISYKSLEDVVKYLNAPGLPVPIDIGYCPFSLEVLEIYYKDGHFPKTLRYPLGKHSLSLLECQAPRNISVDPISPMEIDLQAGSPPNEKGNVLMYAEGGDDFQEPPSTKPMDLEGCDTDVLLSNKERAIIEEQVKRANEIAQARVERIMSMAEEKEKKFLGLQEEKDKLTAQVTELEALVKNLSLENERLKATAPIVVKKEHSEEEDEVTVLENAPILFNPTSGPRSRIRSEVRMEFDQRHKLMVKELYLKACTDYGAEKAAPVFKSLFPSIQLSKDCT